MAMKSILANDNRTAGQQLDMALDANKNCMRANAMLGEIEATAGAHEAAISIWKRIEFQQPQYLSLIAAKMLASYRVLGKTREGVNLLKTYLQTYQLPALLKVVYEATMAEEGAESAASLARNELAKNPSLQTLDQLLEARALLDKNESQDTHLMQQTVRSAIGNRYAYCCEQCGFRARNYHWQCPACNSWESFPPDQKEANA
jgi:lipopolysaccharide biosynthesis regulator YciM